MKKYAITFWLVWMAVSGGTSCPGQIRFSEIMYHPVEEPAFNADGSPVMELYEDVHEFIELHNVGGEAVSLAGWKMTGGVDFTFPTNAVIGPQGYVVVARNPDRLAKVAAYQLQRDSLLGPYEGTLSNKGDSLRLRRPDGQIEEQVSYSAGFPWAIGADALGADQEWSGLNPANYQYRGRSLERVSYTHPANDPANWLASPVPGNPTPGQPNAVSAEVPWPVVANFQVVQAADEAAILRENKAIRITCAFTATNGLSNVSLEWFRDNIDAANEITTVTNMTPDGPPGEGRFSAIIPGQLNRSIIRFRFRADRGKGEETVSPRADDPYRWHACYVTPVRTSPRPIYDCFISSSSLAILNQNISQSPKRVTSPDPPGNPRASWNATEPGVMVCNGVVYDIRARYHGSRYNRRANRNSYKWQFPRYQKFNGYSAIFETDKGNDFIVGHGLFRAAGFPVSAVQYVDLYLNNNAVMQRLEQGEYDGDMLDDYHRRQQTLNPGSPLEPSGDILKDVGTIDMNGEGPYGRGDGRKLSKPPYWSDLKMYEWTFALQNHGWRGSFYFKQMIDAFWKARGDTPTSLNPNIPALRVFFTNYFDIDYTLSYIALENWCCPWDDTTQNHFLWQRRNGKWTMLPWDMDAWYGRGDNTPATASIFMGEVGDPNNNYRGPNFFKDAFIKVFRQELKERFFLLNNTFLHPANMNAMGYSSIASFTQARFASVNQQCGLGVFQRPSQPVNLVPAGGTTALPPMWLQASDYGHSAAPAPAHARTLWELRSNGGNYQEPLWKTNTSEQLTSVPLPFEQLRFGQTYYWRCTYFDTNGHPSLPSVETSFAFGPVSAELKLINIDAATTWKYDQTSTNLATNWTSLAYDDSAWASGAAVLAVENASLAEPIRTPLTLGRMAYYFRKKFTFAHDPRGVELRLRHLIDDGCVVYLNGGEVYRVRMQGNVTSQTAASQNVGDAVPEGPFVVPATRLARGENVIAVEVHQGTSASSDIVFGLSLEATVPAVSGGLVLNEISARNAGSVWQAGHTPDWIELFNAGSQAIDLGGLSLSDNVLQPGKYKFPTNTVAPAQGYLVVWCDADFDSPGLHTGFGLDDEGQTVALFAGDSNAVSVVDYVVFGLQAADWTIGRITNGVGDWRLTQPTPGRANQAQTLGAVTGLKINEWMASPSSGDDWLELYNPDALPVNLSGLFLSDDRNNPTNSSLPDLSFIGPGGFAVLHADENPGLGAAHLDFRLSAGGETLSLYATNGVTMVDQVTYGAQTTGISQGRLPDGGSTIVNFNRGDSAGAGNHLPLDQAAINEVLALAAPPFEQAIEIVNLLQEPLDIGGWWLSDDPGKPQKYPIPSGTLLAPGGFKVFYENEYNAGANPALHLFTNARRGGELALYQADAAGQLTGYRTRVDFSAMESNVSLGRFGTSQGHDFTALAAPTFGAGQPATLTEFRLGQGSSNAPAAVGPVVISEILYHPSDVLPAEEFVELHNLRDIPVPLYDPDFPANTWRLRDAVDFAFPPDTVMPAHGCLVVVAFDPQTNLVARELFVGRYGAQVVLVGPYSGQLDNAGENLELYRSAQPLADGPDKGFVPYILVDRVKYGAVTPWPQLADGTGYSLQRLTNSAYGNEPLNWEAAEPNPGGVPVSGNGPILSVHLNQGKLDISWPAAAANWRLFGARSLIPPATWSAVNELPFLTNGWNNLSLPLEDARFYRLQRE